MKESLFNILQTIVPRARVLDLFCGAGNLGLEAASRQAHHVVFVERDPQALRVLRHNLSTLGLQEPDEVAVVAQDAIRYLQSDVGEPFDVILADPPYDAGLEDPLLQALRPGHLKPGGVFVMQHRRTWSLEPIPAGFHRWRSRNFGMTVIDFLQRQGETDG
jgi:16S rRNA (guanine966-N2)-methyltransferase